MTKLSFLLASLCFTVVLFGQNNVNTIPKKTLKSIPLLTDYLTKDCRNTEDKVDSIYTWITNNIAYDYDLSQSEKYFVGIDPDKILASKKALSNGFVELMSAMLNHAQIENEIIVGYVHEVQWEPGELTINDKHNWIAINIDGEWMLADPTWDAGYVARIPTHLKPYAPKIYKKNTFSTPEKEAKATKKREKTEISRKKKYDDAEPFTKKIGFIRDPNKDYFLIESDSFLVTHLPVLPIWQLRDVIISIEEFSNQEDSLRLTIQDKTTNSINNEGNIETYKEQNYLDQLIIMGEVGALFNPYNPGIKMLNYYNYLVLIHNKNLQKIARGSQFEITPSNYEDIAAKVDTVAQYTKLYKTFEKESYKLIKTNDKEKYKISAGRDKENAKLTKKVNSEYEKQFDRVEKNSDKLMSNAEKINLNIEKVLANYPDADDYKTPDNFELTHIQNYLDSILPNVEFINSRFEELKKLHENSSYNSLFNDIDYLEYLLSKNAEYIQFNSYSTNEITKTIDSLIGMKSNHAIMLFNDSIPMEISDKEIMNALKAIDNQCKLAKSELKLKETQGELQYPIRYENYLQSIHLATLRECLQVQLQNKNFNSAVVKALKKYDGQNKHIGKLMENQSVLKEEKYNYILDQTETDHTRSTALIEKLTNDASSWKKKYSPK